MRGQSLGEAILTKEILVVCGSGGVGKTSVSAALALAAAGERKTIVLTIDPAKRLAASLGLGDGLAHHERRVPGTGELYAAMLDMKTAWDEMIDRYAPSGQVAANIKSNRIYASLSEHFVGSHGYMAMERLADLYEQRAYDLIVIDTPPTRHALDFLDAPKRMTDFVGGSLLKWVARPYAAAGRVGMRAFNFTASPFLRIADRVLGSQVLEDLSSFVIDFQTLYDDFKRRADEVLRLLHRRETGFVVVTTLEGPPLEEAGFFLDRLTDERIPLAGTVANKVFPLQFASDACRPLADALARADTGAIAHAASVDDTAAVADAVREARDALVSASDTASRDVHRIEDLGRRARAPVTAVPLFTRDVHDLESLRELAGYLTG
jgi:anion-transporting  ArsA/GET3 family ATPase